MTLDESRFSALADEVLDRIADAVDDALGDEIDVELHAGILTLGLSAGGQYVINKHAPNRQIWLSSPVGGAFHFDYADGRWVSTRDPAVTLLDLVGRELKARYGVELF